MGKPVQYVNNKDFTEALLRYKKECQESVANGKSNRPRTKTYDYIGKCILQIATRLSCSPNFFNYSWREEFISDAYSDCILRLDNFDINKSSNGFAYFTQICWYAMVRRINTEHKQRDIKCEIIKNSGVIEELSGQINSSEDGLDISTYVNYLLENIDKPKDKIAPASCSKAIKI